MTSFESANDALTYYPRYCFSLSKTYSTWARLSASDIHLRLHQPPSFPCPADTWFILNHPIRAVRIVGTVVAADVYEKRTALVIDDYSGHTLELYANHDECNLTRIQVDDVIKVRGTVSEFRQRKQMTVKKVETVKDEIGAWKEMMDWKREYLVPGVWRLTEDQVAQKRKEYKKAERRKRKEKEAGELRRRKERMENEGDIVIVKDERKKRIGNTSAVMAEIDIVDAPKPRSERIKKELDIMDTEVLIVEDNPIRTRIKRSQSRDPERKPRKKLREGKESSSTGSVPAQQSSTSTFADNQCRAPLSRQQRLPPAQAPPSSSACAMDYDVEIVDDVAKPSRYQPERERWPRSQLLAQPATVPAVRPVATTTTEGWDVEIMEDRRASSTRLRGSQHSPPPKRPKPPKPPSVKSQVLSYLRTADPPNITMRELTDAGITVDIRVIEELMGEGWLLYTNGNPRNRDTVWTYVGEWLIRPELQSLLRRSQTLDARKIWSKLKKREGLNQVGKEVVKEVITRIMENNADWKEDGRGNWRRLDQYG